MPVTVEFSPSDAQIIQRLADRKQVSMAEYIHELTLKAVREAEELDEIDCRLEQVKNGQVVYKTMSELEAMGE